MALPSPDLDDRRFQDLVDEAKRLIPRYCPEWTNHNLSDPGVALIELFAWMSEMVLYRLNQVPDRYYARFLELVGIEPFAPSVARAQLTFWLAAPVEHAVVVPAGTAVATQAGALEHEVVFSTTHELVITHPVLSMAATASGDAPENLTPVLDELVYPGGSVTCFERVPIAAGDAFYLGFDASLANNIVRVDVGATVEGVGVDPEDPPLAWEAWTGETWMALDVHSDTTGGLNRDGSVVMALPPAHAPATFSGHRAWWVRARLLEPSPHQPTYEASPRINSLAVRAVGGTVVADHAEEVGRESLGRSSGGPSQAFIVARPPVLERRDHEQVVVVADRTEQVWTEVDDFAGSKATDRHCQWDGATGVIRFGPRVRYPDGTIRQHGAIPADGAEIKVTGYRHGGGAEGNVGAGVLTRLRTTVPYIDRVENRSPAIGGVDAETVENAKVRGPMTLRTGGRAVTAGDYERLALEATAAVARARCLPPEAPGGPVRLLLVPEVARATAGQQIDDFALSPELLARVGDHLDERRVLGTSVELSTPYYQGLTVAALVTAQPGRPANLVRERVLHALYRFVNPISGGTDGSGWPFSADANVATIGQLIATVEGVERVEEVLLFEVDLRTGHRVGAGREIVRLDDRSLFLSSRHQVVVR